MKGGGKRMLPKELIEDLENDVAIIDLCRKYGLSRNFVRNQLKKMGIKQNTWGGYRNGCGRKKKERNGELQKIREKNAKLMKPTREGVKVKPKFKLW